jgi:hypothetical protein
MRSGTADVRQTNRREAGDLPTTEPAALAAFNWDMVI